jgi:tryptophan-rich sensory protein
MDWRLFLIYLSACVAAGSTGQLFPPGDWYESLRKPTWTPPRWLFPVAWTIIYIAIAVAAARAAHAGAGDFAAAFWSVQIVLNALWTPAFFGLRRPDIGLVVIAAFWFAVLATTIAFARHDAVAAGIFVVYLGWVSFASALNFAVWRLNPGERGR